jgi:hypothetical protein
MLPWKKANLFHAIGTALFCAQLILGNVYIRPECYKDKFTDITT